MIDALNEFKRENPSFIGGKYIYAPRKKAVDESNFAILCRLSEEFPDFVAGFDLVGEEDLSPPLVSFAERILQLPDGMKFFFHAGETNWYGSTDENLVSFIFKVNLSYLLSFMISDHTMHRLMRFCWALIVSVMAMR